MVFRSLLLARRPRPALIVALLTAFCLVAVPFSASSPTASTVFPGGFVEKATSGDIRPRLTQSQIQALLPARGLFVFPTPYNTEAIRISNAGDCGGSDCLESVGYSYWRNINNHAGSDTMLIFLGLSKTRGGGGPTLFSYNKVTEAVSNLGPLFASTSRYSNFTGEGWYFSASMPNALYLFDGPMFLRYDVITKQLTTVFDATTQFGTGKYLWQMHSSSDDRVHSGTLKQASNFASLGCTAYREDTGRFYYYPKIGDFDECQIDKSGRWLIMKDDVDGAHGEDNRIIDLETGTERILLDQDGAAGHSDAGHGYMVSEDNWNNEPGAAMLWKFTTNPPQGQLVYHMTDWSVDLGHVSHANAKAGVAPESQYACSSHASRLDLPRSNEIICFPLDGSMDVLVVAPVMTNMDASGGGDDYTKAPKGNLDPTGQYFIWTSNMGTGRLDAFIVKVPSHRLSSTPLDTIAPAVSIASPAGGTVTGTISVSVSATDNLGVAGVQLKLDGGNLGAEKTLAPYSFSWSSSSTTNGSHILTAVARDAAGNSTVSAPVSVLVSNVVLPSISGVSASGITSIGANITWSTNLATDSQVEYGLTSAYGNATPLQAGMVTSHAVGISGLSAGVLYHYRVKSKDSAGNIAMSPDQTFTTSAPILPGSGLLGYWKFDETSGGTVLDSSASAFSGSLMNGAARTSGRINGALLFDGVNDYASVPHRAALNAYPLTAAVWVKTSATNLGGIVNKYAAASRNGYQIFANSGNICAWYFRDASNYVYDGGGCGLTAAGYADGKWHHVVLTVDASGGKLFVDGAQKAALAWKGTPGVPSSIQELSFGRYPSSSHPFLTGSLDDVRIYNRALSPTEVQGLYASAPALSDTTPPAISSIGVSSLSASGATVTWTTNEASDSQVEFGPTAQYGGLTVIDKALVTGHVRVLSGLLPGRVYHFRVRSRDVAGNLALSGDRTFTTLSAN